MINVNDYIVKVNGELIVPVKRDTPFGTELVYCAKSGKCAAHLFTEYEKEYAQNITVISAIKNNIKDYLLYN